MHLDFVVNDIDEAVKKAESLGATLEGSIAFLKSSRLRLKHFARCKMIDLHETRARLALHRHHTREAKGAR